MMAVSVSNKDELDTLMSPSKWSKRLPAEEVVEHFMSTAERATKAAQKSLKTELSVRYGKGTNTTLDIYYPTENEGTNVFIFIHGGYWQSCGTEHAGMMAVPFTERGIVVVALGHDLAPKVSMTEIVEQCREGCAYVVKKFKNCNIHIGGHSAGAHLSACMLFTDWRERLRTNESPFAFSSATLLSGVYDLGPIQRSYVNDALQLTESEVKQFTLRNLLNQYSIQDAQQQQHIPKCLLAVAEQDTPEFKRQDSEFMKGLKEVGVACRSHELPGEDHFSIVERLEERDFELTKIILEFISEEK